MAIAPGMPVGRYQILSLLGKGGMGEVYLALDTSLKRKVAIKLLPAHYTQESDRVRRFEQEAETASKLNHPSILTIHEIGQVDGAHYLVTEYIEGQTLRERIQQSRLKASEALEITIQIGGALAAAHAANIVHRDIKPENIMLRPDGLVKVLDFGLAKLTERKALSETDAPTLNETASGVLAGTVQYMSPEQARGQKLDYRTDIFSLGAVLYEMVAGVSPFVGGTQAEVFARILEREPVPLLQHTSDAPAELERIVFKALSKNRNQRYQSAQELLTDLSNLKRQLDAGIQIPPTRSPVLPRKLATGIALASLLVLLGATVYFLRNPEPPLTERDTILLADFTNTTGDAVFDGALKQGLAVELEQSPFLDVFPDARLRQTLRLMERSPDGPINREVAREICLRAGLKAFIAGSISALGRNYVIGLEAVNSQTGDVMAREQLEASSKEQVLKTLGETTRRLRKQLGESLTSIQKFDAPLELTTSSLEALKAYSVGTALFQSGKYFDAIGFLKTAVELDPSFGYAYDGLAAAYRNTGQSELARQNAEKAFALRDRVSELEKLRISYFQYYFNGELEHAAGSLELWRQTYPRDYRAPSNLADLLGMLGQHERGLEAAQEAVRLHSPSSATMINLSENLLRLNRFSDASKVSEDELRRGVGSFFFRMNIYSIAFTNGDAATMERQVEAIGTEPDAHRALEWQADVSAFRGQFEKSKDFSRRAVRQSAADNVKGQDVLQRAMAAFRGAVLDRCMEALDGSPREMVDLNQDDLEYFAAAFALCGDVGRAKIAIDAMFNRFPNDTLVKAIALPEARAALALHRLKAQDAIDALEPVRRYEAAAQFRPQYLRGLAYLQLKSPRQAAAEFQRILDHRGQAPLSVLYPLAQLGLARSLVLDGNTAKGRKAYEQLFALWKDAEPELIPLRAARREYEQLESR